MKVTKTQRNLLLAASASAIVLYLTVFRGTTSGNGVDPTGNGSGGNGGQSNPGFDALKVATDLYEAMKDSGTDESAIVQILTRVTPAQFDLVFDAFGVLKYNPTLGNQYSFWGELDRYNLKQWLKYELSETQYYNFKRKFPNRL